jgi:hypothetical protein
VDDSLSTSDESEISQAPVEKTGEFVAELPKNQSDEKDKSAWSASARVVDVHSETPNPEAHGPDGIGRVAFEDLQTEGDSEETKRDVLQRVFVRAAWISGALCLIITFVSPTSTCFSASI